MFYPPHAGTNGHTSQEMEMNGRLMRAPSTTEFHLLTGADLSSAANSPSPGKRLISSQSQHHFRGAGFSPHLNHHNGNGRGSGGSCSTGAAVRGSSGGGRIITAATVSLQEEAAAAAANKKVGSSKIDSKRSTCGILCENYLWY